MHDYSSLWENNEPVNPEVSAPEAAYEACHHRETGMRFHICGRWQIVKKTFAKMMDELGDNVSEEI